MPKQIKTKVKTPNGKELTFPSPAAAADHFGIKQRSLKDWRYKHKERNEYAKKINLIITFGE